MCNESVSQLSEIACSELASAAIEEISKKTKVSPFHLAIHVKGLIHDHPPCDNNVETCAYCKRNGNIFASGKPSGNASDDIIAKYRNKVSKILEEMFTEISDVIVKNAFNAGDSDTESEFDSDFDNDTEDAPGSDDEEDMDKLLSKAFGLSI